MTVELYIGEIEQRLKALLQFSVYRIVVVNQEGNPIGSPPLDVRPCSAMLSYDYLMPGKWLVNLAADGICLAANKKANALKRDIGLPLGKLED